MYIRNAIIIFVYFVAGCFVVSAKDGNDTNTDIIVNGNKFSWVNAISEGVEIPPGTHHSTFVSTSMNREVGYVIYLPPGYDSSENTQQRYPVVYFLHGGRPGRETKNLNLIKYIHSAMASGEVPAAIYVFINGGAISHYNYPEFNSMGEDVFIKELIPYVDANYRSKADRGSRAIEGFSQGGRGTTRIMFKYPELFISAAPGGPGYRVEKQILENDGVEHDTRRENAPRYDFGGGNETFSLAQNYAGNSSPRLNIAIWIGDKGMNYASTLDYMKYLDSLNISYETFIVPDAGHNPEPLYQEIGVDLMNFHARNFR
jgi:S-formylglutathione hydrolase FrmB